VYTKIKDSPNINRNLSSNSIVSVNISEFKKARTRKTKLSETDLRLCSLESSINNVNDKLNTILEILNRYGDN